MEITPGRVKELREKTGAGMMDCKNALTESCGDLEKAVDILRTKGLAKISKRAGRTASQGIIYSYIHTGGKIGVMLELNSETDFVARTPDFQGLAKEIAMQIAAADPLCLDRESVPADVLERERAVQVESARATGKPEAMLAKIAEGKLNKFYQEKCLLEQKSIRDDKRTIQDLVAEIAAKMGENVQLRRFVRFQLGEEL